jgi:hypothetical protein
MASEDLNIGLLASLALCYVALNSFHLHGVKFRTELWNRMWVIIIVFVRGELQVHTHPHVHYKISVCDLVTYSSNHPTLTRQHRNCTHYKHQEIYFDLLFVKTHFSGVFTVTGIGALKWLNFLY